VQWLDRRATNDVAVVQLSGANYASIVDEIRLITPRRPG